MCVVVLCVALGKLVAWNLWTGEARERRRSVLLCSTYLRDIRVLLLLRKAGITGRRILCKADGGGMSMLRLNISRDHIKVLNCDDYEAGRIVKTNMSHHLFLLSPSDTPLYSLTHFSAKASQAVPSPLSANLPGWSTSAFAGTLTALSGASSVVQTNTQGGGVRMGGGQDRHVIQMIANASLDVVEDVARRDNGM